MPTRSSIHEFIRTQCKRGPGIATPTTEFYDSLRRWAHNNGHMAPSIRLIKATLREDLGIEARGSRHSWVFPGITMLPVACPNCREMYDPEVHADKWHHLYRTCVMETKQ